MTHGAEDAQALLARIRAGELAGSTRLALRGGLTELPPEVFRLADTLEMLDLSGNALTALPDALARLPRLRILFASDNRFTELPPVLGRCAQLEMVGFKANAIRDVPAAALPPRLRWLILTDNQIEQLPAALGGRERLQKLMLSGNRLRALPGTLAQCRRLELLRLASNQLEALPAGLLALPRLAWLALAGNPLSPVPAAAASSAPRIDWHDLGVHVGALGSGASGVIHRADWRRPDGTRQPVALKLFKGQVTSDGLPEHEMAACLAAGTHAHLLPVLGRLAGHPAGTPGLVLELLASAYAPLAGPPSLQSCTRDVYADGLRLPARAALGLARGIVSAVAQLHARGITHGDIYAHNLLWRADSGHGLLSDFGAASFFDRAAPEAAALVRLESRALGCLLEELARHGDPASPGADPILPALAQLAARCDAPAVQGRPDAAELSARLDAIAA